MPNYSLPPRYTPDTRRLGDIFGRTGEQLSNLSMDRGRQKAEFAARLGAIFSGYTEGKREDRQRAETISIRAAEQEAAKKEREAVRLAEKAEREAIAAQRTAERADDAKVRATEQDRAAASKAIDRAAPGPQSEALYAMARKFPELAAQFRVQAPIEARVTPGAMGEVAPTGPAYPVLEATADQAEAAGDRQFRKEQAAITEAARVRDDVRATAAEARTGRYQDESLKIARTAAETARMNAETTRQRYTGAGVDTTKLGPMANVLDRAILTITPNKRGPILALAHRYADEGNEKALKEVIQQAAIENEPVGTKEQIRSRQATIAALDDARSVLQGMKAAGVPSNIFSGTAEDIARKLGTSTDPRYVAFGAQLRDTLINYRRAATGAAFGAKEGEDYERLFPNYRQTMPVNEAVIEGLSRSMRNTDRSYWRGKLGEDGVRAVFGDGDGDAEAAGGVEHWERGADGKLHKVGG